MPIFATRRLIVRPWTLAQTDIAWAHRIYSDPMVVKTIGGRLMTDIAATEQHVRMRLDRQRKWGGRYGAFAIQRRSDAEVVGSVLIKPLKGHGDVWTDDIEIGWHLARVAWGHGYATEAAQGLVRHAKTLGIAQVHIVVEPGNQRSLNVAGRLGAQQGERTTRYYDGIPLEHFTLAVG